MSCRVSIGQFSFNARHIIISSTNLTWRKTSPESKAPKSILIDTITPVSSMEPRGSKRRSDQWGSGKAVANALLSSVMSMDAITNKHMDAITNKRFVIPGARDLNNYNRHTNHSHTHTHSTHTCTRTRTYAHSHTHTLNRPITLHFRGLYPVCVLIWIFNPYFLEYNFPQ